jgi:hypothetical protein
LVANQFPKRADLQGPNVTNAPHAGEDQSTTVQTGDQPTQVRSVASAADGGGRELVAVPWWQALDLQSRELNWEPEWLSVSDLTPDAILDIAKEFRITVNEMHTAPYVVGRWAEMSVLEECEKLAILAAGYGLDPKPLLQIAWNIDRNRFADARRCQDVRFVP